MEVRPRLADRRQQARWPRLALTLAGPGGRYFSGDPKAAPASRFKPDSLLKLFRRSDAAPVSEDDPEFFYAVARPGLIDEVAAVCRLRYEQADISERLDTPIPYLRVVTHRPFQRAFPVGVASGGLTPAYIRAFAAVHQLFANNDPSVESLLVYPGAMGGEELLAALPTPAIRALPAEGHFRHWQYPAQVAAVPEGRLTIAQHLSAGSAMGRHQVPEGRPKHPLHAAVVPAGLGDSAATNPALKCWAIFGRPSGTVGSTPGRG